MIKTKKSEGSMPLVIIISAVILLVVAVIMIYFVSDQSGNFIADANNCETKGGDCVDKSDCSKPFGSFSCGKDSKKVCCFSDSGLI